MRRAWLLALVVGCAAKTAAPKPTGPTNPGAAYAVTPWRGGDWKPPTYGVGGVSLPVGPIPSLRPPPLPSVALLPQPPIDLTNYYDLDHPDFHDELRWPLTPMSHPSLEPRFAIAQALAQPGVGWMKLCSLGAQNRHGVDLDLLAYLRGWCSAIEGDVDAACRNLAPLLGSATTSISSATKIDLANILADQGSADKAERWLNRHHIHDIEVIDLLAANYVEVGTRSDALTINRLATASDDRATLATRCSRLAREILLTDDRGSRRLEELAALATPKNLYGGKGDETCSRLHHKLQCWAKDECNDFFYDHGVSRMGVGMLRDVTRDWPLARTETEWRLIASEAMYGVKIEGVAALVLAAFENALRTAGACSDDSKSWLKENENYLQGEVEKSTELTKQFDWIVAMCK